MAFKDRIFPLKIGFGSAGGPERRTQIVTTASGREERNQQWANSRRVWDVGANIRETHEAEAVIAFFEEMRGRLYGFRFTDPMDFKSCPVTQSPGATDQVIGEGDGSQTTFNLIKVYGTDDPYQRRIHKPDDGSVLIAVGGATVNPSSYAVDYSTGIVTFNAAPTNGDAVTAGYKYHVPARFNVDQIPISWDGHDLISVPSIPIVELIL